MKYSNQRFLIYDESLLGSIILAHIFLNANIMNNQEPRMRTA